MYSSFESRAPTLIIPELTGTLELNPKNEKQQLRTVEFCSAEALQRRDMVPLIGWDHDCYRWFFTWRARWTSSGHEGLMKQSLQI